MNIAPQLIQIPVNIHSFHSNSLRHPLEPGKRSSDKDRFGRASRSIQIRTRAYPCASPDLAAARFPPLPPPRRGFALTLDVDRQEALLFGGYNSSQY